MLVIKEVEWKLISELIKNARKSDRELAKAVGASQPTVSRLRRKLEKKQVIMEYAMKPSLVKLGFELLAVIFAQLDCDRQSYPKLVERARVFLEKHPNIIYASKGQGLHSDRMTISIHRNYLDYSKFMQAFRVEFEDYYTITETFLTSLRDESVLRPISLRYIADHLKEELESK